MRDSRCLEYEKSKDFNTLDSSRAVICDFVKNTGANFGLLHVNVSVFIIHYPKYQLLARLRKFYDRLHDVECPQIILLKQLKTDFMIED